MEIESLDAISHDPSVLAHFIEKAIRDQTGFSIKKPEHDQAQLIRNLPKALELLGMDKTMMLRHGSSKEHMNQLVGVKVDKADRYAEKMRPVIEEIEKKIVEENDYDKIENVRFRQIADKLNEIEIPTPGGKDYWLPSTVWNLKKRIENLSKENKTER